MCLGGSPIEERRELNVNTPFCWSEQILLDSERASRVAFGIRLPRRGRLEEVFVRISILLISAAVLTCSVSRTQVERGAIVGIVSDPTGGVVYGAEIQVRNIETNVTFETSSDATGSYV